MRSGPARVLEALRRAGGDPCSGETLSSRYGVTRAQVWKDVEALRARGYEIEACPGGGYSLAGIPDRLYPEEIEPRLGTRWLARRIEYLDTTDSTNRVAGELARAGAPHGTTAIAEGQTAGRGRLGRGFFSPPYLNLYSSILLRPELTTADAPAWILASAVGVALAIEAEVDDPSQVEIKWPNDVLLGGRKTCGILMELGAEATRVSYLVLGIGVNLNVSPDDFPEEFRDRATSLAGHTGRRIDRVRFAARLYTTLEQVLDLCADGGFAAVRPRFEARFRMAGRPVRVLATGEDELRGTALGIDAQGALRVRRPDGHEVRIVAGDVSLAKEDA